MAKIISFEVTDQTFTRLVVQAKLIHPPITLSSFLRRMLGFYLEKLEAEPVITKSEATEVSEHR